MVSDFGTPQSLLLSILFLFDHSLLKYVYICVECMHTIIYNMHMFVFFQSSTVFICLCLRLFNCAYLCVCVRVRVRARVCVCFVCVNSVMSSGRQLLGLI